MFAGNVREHHTLAEMLDALHAPRAALVVMDRGIATVVSVPEILTAAGPTFVDLKVVPGGAYEYRWDIVHGPESRTIFREVMQAVPAAR